MREDKYTWFAAASVAGLLSWGCFSDLSEERDFEDTTFVGVSSLNTLERPAKLPRYQGSTVKTPPMGIEDVALLQDGVTIVATDAATNTAYFVDTKATKRRGSLVFESGAHPGRVSAHGESVYIVLRGNGEVVRANVKESALESRVQVCDAPRGVAHDALRNRVWVACASGELVSLDPETLEVLSTTYLDADLRDVVVTPKGVFVSRFRAAEVLSINPATGAEISRVKLESDRNTTANTLWRMRPTPEGDVVTAYQESADQNLSIPDEGVVIYYGSGATGGCGSVVSSMTAVVRAREDGSLHMPGGPQCSSNTTLPVDVLVTNAHCRESAVDGASRYDDEQESRRIFGHEPGYQEYCSKANEPFSTDATNNILAITKNDAGDIITLTRGKDLSVQINTESGTKIVSLRRNLTPHLGQTLFHADSGNGIACASCHPEGNDDGHIWQFERMDQSFRVYEEFSRRTQNLRGGIEGKLHWDGEFEDIDELMTNVFTTRMGGFTIGDRDGEAIRNWLNTLQPQTGQTLAPGEQLSAERGKELYEDAQVGCTSCHGGEKHTDYKLYDVGTGGTFKTPTLRGISQRHQLMHDGCAKTLRDRFDPACGGSNHGDLSDLTADDLDDLTTYLKTL